MFDIVRLCCVGDMAVGKTSVLMTLINNYNEQQPYVPTVFESYVHFIEFEKRLVSLSIWDTSGSDRNGCNAATLVYSTTDCFIVVYAMDNPTSFKNAITHWIPNIRHKNPDGLIILVGNKTDLPVHLHAINNDVAKQVASKLQIAAWFQCSIKNNVGIQKMFHQIINLVMKLRKLRHDDEIVKKRMTCGCAIH